jgi:tetratricopeptide (TPR) repeat protein
MTPKRGRQSGRRPAALTGNSFLVDAEELPPSAVVDFGVQDPSGSGNPSTSSQTASVEAQREALARSIGESLQTLARKMFLTGDVDEFTKAVAEGDIERAKLFFPRKVEAQRAQEFFDAVQRVLTDPQQSAHHGAFAAMSADVALKLEDFDSAERFGKTALALLPSTNEPVEVPFAMTVLLGMVQAHRGRPQLALEYYARAIDSYPQVEPKALAWAQHNRGSAFLDLGDAVEASSSYRKAASLRAACSLPNEPSHTLCRAADAIHRTNARQALVLYEEALATLPQKSADETQWVKAHALLAVGLIRLHDLHEAGNALAPLEASTALLRHMPAASMEFTSSLNALAIALRENDRAAEAAAVEAEATATIEANPAGFHALMKRALKDGSYPDPAVNDADSAESLQAASHFGEAVALAEKDPLSAVAAVERAVEATRTTRAESYAKRGGFLLLASEILSDAGNLEGAIPYASRAYAEYPADIMAGVKLVRLLVSRQRIDEAFLFAQRLTRDHAQNYRAFLLAGHCAKRAGDFARALPFFERATQLSGDRADIAALAAELRQRIAGGDLPGMVTQLSTLPALLPANDAEFLRYLQGFARRVEENSASFWKSRAERRWAGNPESIGRGLLIQGLKEHGSSVSCFREVEIGGGRIDLVVNILGRNFVVELKVCGPGYSTTYTGGGFEQLCDYMRQMGASRGFLVIFDARVDASGDEIPSELNFGDELLAYVVRVNVLGMRQQKKKRPRRKGSTGKRTRPGTKK